MRCVNHNNETAIDLCPVCGKWVCENCLVEIDDRTICKNCAGIGYKEPTPPPPTPASTENTQKNNSNMSFENNPSLKNSYDKHVKREPVSGTVEPNYTYTYTNPNPNNINSGNVYYYSTSTSKIKPKKNIFIVILGIILLLVSWPILIILLMVLFLVKLFSKNN